MSQVVGRPSAACTGEANHNAGPHQDTGPHPARFHHRLYQQCRLAATLHTVLPPCVERHAGWERALGHGGEAGCRGSRGGRRWRQQVQHAAGARRWCYHSLIVSLWFRRAGDRAHERSILVPSVHGLRLTAAATMESMRSPGGSSAKWRKSGTCCDLLSARESVKGAAHLCRANPSQNPHIHPRSHPHSPSLV